MLRHLFMKQMNSIFLKVVMILGLVACNKEDCERLIPGKVADRLVTDGYSCDSIETLLLGTIGFYQALCMEQLQADSEYQWHCGQHNHFTPAELEGLCLEGLNEFISRCNLKMRRISIESPEIENPLNYSAPSYTLD